MRTMKQVVHILIKCYIEYGQKRSYSSLLYLWVDWYMRDKPPNYLLFRQKENNTEAFFWSEMEQCLSCESYASGEFRGITNLSIFECVFMWNWCRCKVWTIINVINRHNNDFVNWQSNRIKRMMKKRMIFLFPPATSIWKWKYRFFFWNMERKT